jgi:hypothetical protein
VGASCDYGNQTRAHAEKGQVKRSGLAGRCGEGGSFFSPATTQHSTPARRRKPSAAARPSAAEKGPGRIIPTMAIQLARTPKKTRLSAAARPSAAQKGGLGVSFDYDTTQHARAQKKAKRSGKAGRSGLMGSGVFPRLR